MMEAGWSARRVARQLGRFDYVPTASSAAIQAQVAPSLGAPCLLEPYEGAWLKDIGITAPITCVALDAHSATPPFGVVPRTRKLDCSRMEPGRL
ncbi:hypothetical protein TNCV_3697071 [Trichonephila clavipes]|uniref:Uncharacterized protein n=1 Tax=Trichonephila clavipes TaxID=2585209 RepID=A0A8X6SE59_TRICX|nr:hypothetical protein TNCV_3697071 [Trichonephila clavipes]